MSLRIDLLRHGETERGGGFRGSLDDALTARGWQQMHAALHGAGPWDALISSPLQRCAAFASQLAAQRALPLRPSQSPKCSSRRSGSSRSGTSCCAASS